ncbi:glycosyltransferase family 4 protein [Patulibacter sp.]|uniref:glycosyltransferase family 4 protein n=1 Tax=Patulibacter sp. TaxID=1912859 RepID=UPI0027273869|nr:glycosyltransferase family 4 protein [Patulibacter sp.]MDO9407230.1 glycosyltransferase family 4 protein [Patulibacter sp.]
MSQTPTLAGPGPATPRLRIATMVDYVVGGGAERAAVEIACRLAERHDVTMISSRLRPDQLGEDTFRGTVAQLADAGVTLWPLGRTSAKAVWEWRPLIRRLRAGRFDVLHTHLSGSNAWGPLLKGLGGVGAFVAHEQTPFPHVGGFRGFRESRSEAFVNPWVVGPLADRILVPSRWSLESLVDLQGVPREKMRVVPNAAPETMDRPSDDRRGVRASMGVADDELVIVIAAMLRPEKGHEIAVDALARVLPRYPKAVLALAGEGELHAREGVRPALEAQARALGIEHAVRFLGRRHDVMDVLGASDVALLSSHNENLPLAVLEYMESGTPIVTTDAGGNRELVDDGVHGLVVPRGDAAAMADALLRTLDDPDAARTRATAAQERRRREFTWDVVSRQVEDVYREALAA